MVSSPRTVRELVRPWEVFVVHGMRQTREHCMVVLRRRTDDGGADPSPTDDGGADPSPTDPGSTDARADDGVANPSPTYAGPTDPSTSDPGADAESYTGTADPSTSNASADAESNAGTDTADPRFAMPRRSTIPAATTTSRARGVLLVGRTAFRLQYRAHPEGRRQCVWHSATS